MHACMEPCSSYNVDDDSPNLAQLAYYYTEQAPTGLTVRQVGTRSVRISWILPAQNSRSRSGYRISTSRDFSAGITVATDATHRLIDQAPGRVNYWLISLSTPSIMVGPVTGTIRGEEFQKCILYDCMYTVFFKQISIFQ